MAAARPDPWNRPSHSSVHRATTRRGSEAPRTGCRSRRRRLHCLGQQVREVALRPSRPRSDPTPGHLPQRGQSTLGCQPSHRCVLPGTRRTRAGLGKEPVQVVSTCSRPRRNQSSRSRTRTKGRGRCPLVDFSRAVTPQNNETRQRDSLDFTSWARFVAVPRGPRRCPLKGRGLGTVSTC
jgi:hypothetical protein